MRLMRKSTVVAIGIVAIVLVAEIIAVIVLGTVISHFIVAFWQ